MLNQIRQDFGSSLVLALTGGEALDHPDFFEIADHIASLGLPWGLVSNGFSWKEDTLDRLVASGLRSLTLSLDGPEAVHNWLRNHPDSFRRVIRILDSLKSGGHGLLYDVVTCVHPGNLDILDQTADILLEHGVPAWRVFRIFPQGRAKDQPALSLDHVQTAQMIDWVTRSRPGLARRGLRLDLSCEGWFPLPREDGLRSQASFCRSGINFASILADGSIGGCSNNHPEFMQGNVLTENFAWVWENRFQDHRTRSWLSGSTCKTCRHLKDCRGGALHLWHDRHQPVFCYHRPYPAPEADKPGPGRNAP